MERDGLLISDRCDIFSKKRLWCYHQTPPGVRGSRSRFMVIYPDCFLFPLPSDRHVSMTFFFQVFSIPRLGFVMAQFSPPSLLSIDPLSPPSFRGLRQLLRSLVIMACSSLFSSGSRTSPSLDFCHSPDSSPTHLRLTYWSQEEISSRAGFLKTEQLVG